MQVVLSVIATALLLLNGLGPLLVYTTLKLPGRTRLESLEPGEFDEAVSSVARDNAASVESLGYRRIGSCRFFSPPNTVALFALYIHADGSSASIVDLTQSDQMLSSYLEFTQLYQDGSVLDVCNTDQPNAYPDLAMKCFVRLPKVTDVAELHRCFQCLREALDNTSPERPYLEEDGFGPVVDYMARESDELVERGWIREEMDEDGLRRPTLFGAYAMCWRSIVPGKWWFRYREERLARSLMARCRNR